MAMFMGRNFCRKDPWQSQGIRWRTIHLRKRGLSTTVSTPFEQSRKNSMQDNFHNQRISDIKIKPSESFVDLIASLNAVYQKSVGVG